MHEDEAGVPDGQAQKADLSKTPAPEPRTPSAAERQAVEDAIARAVVKLRGGGTRAYSKLAEDEAIARIQARIQARKKERKLRSGPEISEVGEPATTLTCEEKVRSNDEISCDAARTDNAEHAPAVSSEELLRQYDLQPFSPPPASAFESEVLDALKDGYPRTYKRFRRDGLLDNTVKRLGESAEIVARQVWQHLVNQGDAPGPALMSALDVARTQMQDELRSIAGPQKI